MTDKKSDLPHVFKGIALFTPGGDFIYGIDPTKQNQWHIHLCLGLQKIWGLSEPPYFLVPGYTATVDRWLDPQTQQLKVVAEVYPALKSYIPLLRALFDLELETEWHIARWREEYCDRAVLETYRDRFPQLWEARDLIVRLDPNFADRPSESEANSSHKLITKDFSPIQDSQIDKTGGYVLKLFISSDRSAAEKTLASIHQLLERGLTSPYTLKVIDISRNPEQAEIHQVTATPMLVRVWPQPVKRIVGQLDDIQKVLRIISSF